MNSVIVNLNIGRQELMKYYRDGVQTVLAYSEDGQAIRFPVNAIRSFVSSAGVKGRFLIQYQADGKLVQIRPV